MRARSSFALAATASLIFALGACDGLKEALTAHVDVAAKAANQELSVTRLADLLGNAKVPVKSPSTGNIGKSGNARERATTDSLRNSPEISIGT